MMIVRALASIFFTVAALVAGPMLSQGLSMPAGANLAHEDTTDPGSYAMPVGPFEDGTIPVEMIEGAVLRQAFRVPGNSGTTLQLLAPLRGQIAELGYEVVFECATRQCGGFDFRFGTEVLPGPGMYVDLTDFRFLSARDKGGGAISVLVSRSTGAGFIQTIRVGSAASVSASIATAPGPTAAVIPKASGPFGAQLDAAGRVVLSDLSFATGSSDLGNGTFDSLAEVAAYLKSFPDRRIALVGHTDSVGSLENNINLSRRRAASVLEHLVSDYGVPRSQLEAGGMGYLAPLTSNLTAAGREANRRVEAVLVSTQ